MNNTTNIAQTPENSVDFAKGNGLAEEEEKVGNFVRSYFSLIKDREEVSGDGVMWNKQVK